MVPSLGRRRGIDDAAEGNASDVARTYVAVLAGMDVLLALLIAAFVISIQENGRWGVATASGIIGALAVVGLWLATSRGVKARRSGGAMAAATTGGLLASEFLHGIGEAIFLGTISGFLIAFAVVLNAIAVARIRAAARAPDLPLITERDVARRIEADAERPDVRLL